MVINKIPWRMTSLRLQRAVTAGGSSLERASLFRSPRIYPEGGETVREAEVGGYDMPSHLKLAGSAAASRVYILTIIAPNNPV